MIGAFMPTENWDEELTVLGGRSPSDRESSSFWPMDDPSLASMFADGLDDMLEVAGRRSARLWRPAQAAAVYFIQDGEGGPIKIGKSRSPWARLAEFQTHHLNELILLVATHRLDEGELHREFAHLRLRGEWFAPEEELWLFIKCVIDREARPA